MAISNKKLVVINRYNYHRPHSSLQNITPKEFSENEKK